MRFPFYIVRSSCHFFSALGLFLTSSITLGADQVAQTPSMPGVESFFQMFFGLIVVLLVIFILATVFKKLNLVNVGGNNLINVIASQPLSNKEKLVLVQVGEDQILVGMSPGNISKLHKLSRNVNFESYTPLPEGQTDFTRMLKSVLNKSRVGDRS